MVKFDMPSFDVVIPLIPQHDSQMNRIFSILSRQNIEISQVILARSETWAPKKYLEHKFRKSAGQAGLKCLITVVPIRTMNADGSNRNRGWELCQSEFVVFLDADDNYSDEMLANIQMCIESTGADAIIHNFESEDSAPANKILDLASNEITTRAFLAKEKDSISEFYAIVDCRGKELRVHFAHLTIRRTLIEKFQYSDRFPGADQELVQRLVRDDVTVFYIPKQLSSWSRERSLRYLVRIYRKRIFKSIKKIFS